MCMCYGVFSCGGRGSGISDAKLLHVAAVAAELLDQNEDGLSG